nr:trafficking protein particle complex subunit 11 isoform X1 [Ipomoea batatas]
MEEYPEELRTPPVALVSLVGCPDLHATITAHLHAEQPPINALALPDFSKISILAKSPKDNPASSQPVGGILKRDWLAKHRTRVPAVVAALFNYDHVTGDPAQWLQVCTDLENLKAVMRGRNSKLVVVVVAQSNAKDEVSEDRMIALRKRAELDSKHLIIFVPNEPSELNQSLNRLGTTFAELANGYYRDEGRKIKARIERRNLELNIRYCFKVAVYAEFRRDWGEALRMYDDAYHVLREMVGTSTRLPPIQRLVEIKSVAEQLNFKISTLLLHGGKVLEAIAWFRQHNASYRKLVGAPEVTFLHWEWLSRQFLVFAELLETSSATNQNLSSAVSDNADRPTMWEFHSAYYFQLSAQYLKEKSLSFELALSMSEHSDEIDSSTESVTASTYIGQFGRLLENGETLTTQPLTDEEYVRYTLAEGKRFQDSYEIIALLKKSSEAYKNIKALRMASYCEFQIAREYFTMGQFDNAKELLDSVTRLYRLEGWVTLLWDALCYLRECSRRCGTVKDFVEYSLEMAALPVSSNAASQLLKDCGPTVPASLSQREIIHNKVFAVVRGESGGESSEENDRLRVYADKPLYLEIDLVSPLRAVLLASVAFHEQIIKPGAPTMITLSLLSRLPLNVEVEQLEIQFNQSECNFIIVNGQRSHLASISRVQPGRRVETAPTLELITNKWVRLTYEIKSEQSGKLECIYVIARLGQYFTISCRAESPASMNDLSLWKHEDRVETIPTKDPGLALSGQKAVQVEEPDPQVDLKLASSGPALVGERFIVPVIITSKGHAVHSGELKINLVDTRGSGLLSPRESELSTTIDNLHVELVGISGQGCEDQSEANSENTRKIQPTFGWISIPFLNEGDSWSCKLEIRWNRPKPIMLYVSLSYSPHGTEKSTQRVNVHKSLQIEGKTAIVMSHLFMLPFRREPLLLSKTKPGSDPDQTPTLASNETNMLVVTAKNSTEVPLLLMSMSIEADEDGPSPVQSRKEDAMEPMPLVAGEEFKKVFAVTPEATQSKLSMGTVCLRWKRDSEIIPDATKYQVSTKYSLPDVKVEVPPLVVSIDCPPHAILGNAFTCSIRISNRTPFLQEIKYSLADSQTFVLSGSHNDTIFVLPRSDHLLSHKLVPLASGFQQLPRVTVTSVRHSARVQPSVAASTVFVFPSSPHLKSNNVVEAKMESVAAE